jgi:pyrroloquinoline quinone (PQQ) biosynthesis protein C
MSRHTLVKIATVLREYQGTPTHKELARKFARALGLTDKNGKQEKFLIACGVD